MEGNARPTRWQKARSDWSGIHARREIVSGLVGAAVSVVVLIGAGFGHDALVVGITIWGSALAAAVLVPAGEFAWNWLQAPMRLLTEDVIAIRERVEAAPAKAVSSKPRVNVRATLLMQLRKGREITGLSIVKTEYVEQWTDQTTEFVAEYLPDVVEGFLEATQNTGRVGMEERIAYLQQIADGMKDEK